MWAILGVFSVRVVVHWLPDWLDGLIRNETARLFGLGLQFVRCALGRVLCTRAQVGMDRARTVKPQNSSPHIQCTLPSSLISCNVLKVQKNLTTSISMLWCSPNLCRDPEGTERPSN